MKTIVLYFSCMLLLACGCGNRLNQGSNSNKFSMECDESLYNEYAEKTPCDKINFLQKAKNLNNKCYEKIAEDMYSLTGIRSSMEAGFYGIYYLSDSLLTLDIKRWQIALKCEDAD
jgi:hypothetical protein